MISLQPLQALSYRSANSFPVDRYYHELNSKARFQEDQFRIGLGHISGMGFSDEEALEKGMEEKI